VPTNPTLRIYDPRPVAKLAQSRGIPLVMDTTFASPVNLRAGELGADVVVHSATKYLGGHSDVIAGVVVGARELIEEVTSMMKLYGPSIDPHACWLLDRGLRTLDVRVTRQNESALGLALWLSEQKGVREVIHPGLPGHPDHALASEILDGFGGMVSFVLTGGGKAADTFMNRLRLAIPAPSLGGVETLVSQPRHTSHAGMSAAQRRRIGIPDGFVRVSVGVEDLEDLIADFGAALRRVR
jgi:cystathionine beta-lyase/cystathionine gamma-synthase